MRPRIRNMRESDKRILKFLYNGDESELIATPVIIAANIDYADDTVRKRMKPLRSSDLVKYHDEGRGMYTIGDLGRKYIENDLTDDDVAKIESGLGTEE